MLKARLVLGNDSLNGSFSELALRMNQVEHEELSRISEPSADFHCPAACQALRPWGKRGVTTLPRKADHSSTDTTPVGLAVPK